MPNISLPISGSGMEDLYYPGAGSSDTDFIGFTFNGHHSSTLGFHRVSEGNRYNENLYGSFQDTTVQVPGGDGLYYFRSNYTSRVFNISIAFDSMTETQFREMRNIFSGNTMGPLIFDEAPYKAYSVKLQSPPQLKYICFDEGGSRIYKGEGTINFVSYYPYASSVHKFLDQYDDSLYPTKNQWKASSRMLDESKIVVGGSEVLLDRTLTKTINVYNPGDVEADCIICCTISVISNQAIVLLDSQGNEIKRLEFNQMSPLVENERCLINSRTNLIEGCNNDKVKNGHLFNSGIKSGDFFKIPVCATPTDYYQIQIDSDNNLNIRSVDYNYLYY